MCLPFHARIWSTSLESNSIVKRAFARAQSVLLCASASLPGVFGYAADSSVEREASLVGYWKLQGVCRDYSGHNNDGVNHGVDLRNSTFDGIKAFIEVPSSPSLKF